MIRRVRHISIWESHYSPDHRAIVARLHYGAVSVQLVNLYLKSKGEPHEIKVTLDRATPFMNATQCRRRRPQCKSRVGFAQSGGLNPSHRNHSRFSHQYHHTAYQKADPRPTWISAQGYAGALHHFFVTQISDKQPKTHIHYDVVFPTYHFPVVLQIYSLKVMEPPSNIWCPMRCLCSTCLSAKGTEQDATLYGLSSFVVATLSSCATGIYTENRDTGGMGSS